VHWVGPSTNDCPGGQSVREGLLVNQSDFGVDVRDAIWADASDMTARAMIAMPTESRTTVRSHSSTAPGANAGR
jgi:hypothetical protein